MALDVFPALNDIFPTPGDRLPIGHIIEVVSIFRFEDRGPKAISRVLDPPGKPAKDSLISKGSVLETQTPKILRLGNSIPIEEIKLLLILRGAPQKFPNNFIHGFGHTFKDFYVIHDMGGYVREGSFR